MPIHQLLRVEQITRGHWYKFVVYLPEAEFSILVFVDLFDHRFKTQVGLWGGQSFHGHLFLGIIKKMYVIFGD